jgi:predicted YcjX-like family ATPase
LRACRDERFAMSLLPPGRFLMPAISPIAGADLCAARCADRRHAPEGSLWAMMVRRYEAYKDVVVRPFFRDHFARLDRQIVLVDALAAFNAGPEALHDLEAALAGILDCFRIGRATFSPACSGRASTASCSPPPRPIICIIRATTGWRRSCARTWRRPPSAPNMRKPRSTWWRLPRCAPRARHGRARPRKAAVDPRHAGAGESANGETFDGETEVATFPGDLPADPEALFRATRFRGLSSAPRRRRISASCASAAAARTRRQREPALPHIRLDRALQFLIGDRLQ